MPQGKVTDNAVPIVYWELEDGKPKRLVGNTTEIGSKHWRKVDSLDEAEKIALNLGYTVNSKFTLPDTEPLTERDLTIVAVLINKAANMVARNCRRGAGNTVIYNPALTPLIEQVSRESDFLGVSFKLIENENCPEDHLVVLYLGNEKTDQPFVYTEENGEPQFFSNSLGKNVLDYGQRIELTT